METEENDTGIDHTRERVNAPVTSASAPTTHADYYMENGFVVFTAAYHLKRGYCCRSGCRHCPYGFKSKP